MNPVMSGGVDQRNGGCAAALFEARTLHSFMDPDDSTTRPETIDGAIPADRDGSAVVNWRRYGSDDRSGSSPGRPRRWAPVPPSWPSRSRSQGRGTPPGWSKTWGGPHPAECLLHRRIGFIAIPGQPVQGQKLVCVFGPRGQRRSRVIGSTALTTSRMVSSSGGRTSACRTLWA